MVSEIKNFLSQQNWAVMGVSSDPNKFGYKVYFQLKKAGYTVYAINPKLDSIEGDPVYNDLTKLPIKPDAISIVLPPKVTEQVIAECIKLNIPKVWMQPGSESPVAINNAKEHGITVIHNQCILVETRNNSFSKEN